MKKANAECFATAQGKKIIQNSTEMTEIMVTFYIVNIH